MTYFYCILFYCILIHRTRCAVDVHLCGEPCALSDKKGCLGECTEVRNDVISSGGALIFFSGGSSRW
jgi:hypothetical protein